MTTNREKVLKPLPGLWKLAHRLCNEFRARQIMGYSRDAFYQQKDLYEGMELYGVRSVWLRHDRRPSRKAQRQSPMETFQQSQYLALEKDLGREGDQPDSTTLQTATIR